MAVIDLKDKVAIITGASRGIGRSIAQSLMRENMRLALVGRDIHALQSLCESVSADKKRVLPLSYDLLDKDTPQKVVADTINYFGSLDVLINNAGIAQAIPFEASSFEAWESHINLNARAPFFLCQAALKHLKKSDSATIINIASVVAHKSYVNQALYSASKHALLGFSKVLAQEVFKDNIRVHVISPGSVLTEMIAGVRPDLNQLELISPDEIAEVVVFLLKHRGHAVIDEIRLHRSSKQPWE